MRDGEAVLAWVLFWIFTLITTTATFFIVDHHRSRRMAIGLSFLTLSLFVGLFCALRALLRYLGL